MPTVLLEPVDQHVTLITLNRPDRLNALDFGLVTELHDALDAVSADADCKVAIVTGAGRGFCSGLDLKDWGTPPAPGAHLQARVGVGGQELIANLTVHMRQTPQVIVAAVNGVAFGGGLSLACAADIRVSAASARFCSAYIRTGLTGTDIGISHLLPRIVGAGRAFDMIVTGREVDAADAERMGLVTKVVAEDALLDETRELARGIAGYTSTGLVMTKEVFWHNVDNPSLPAALAIENRNQAIASATPEVQQFMAAYRERTTPRSKKGEGRTEAENGT